jgi:hypothetical protein
MSDPKLEKLLRALARGFAREEKWRELKLCVLSNAWMEPTDCDDANEGLANHCGYGYVVHLEVSEDFYPEIAGDIPSLQDLFKKRSKAVEFDDGCWVDLFQITVNPRADESWRQNAQAFLTKKGLTNQGRVRSDNIAPLEHEGLLFRSCVEMQLFDAFMLLGVAVAPLPVFLRGGDKYDRIEPDFLLLWQGLLMVVEVDGNAFHKEAPLQAHRRTGFLQEQGAIVHRVAAAECESKEKALECAKRVLDVLNKHKQAR